VSAVADLQTYLDDQGIIDGSTDWPSVRRRLHDGTVAEPVNQLVVLTEDGGPQPETPADEGMGDCAWRFPTVQVRVRGDRLDSDAAEAKAQEIYDALHGQLGVTMGEVEYAGVHALSEPLFIGFDEKGRPEFTFSVQMTRPVRIPASL
jgi:hypothetical protein